MIVQPFALKKPDTCDAISGCITTNTPLTTTLGFNNDLSESHTFTVKQGSTVLAKVKTTTNGVPVYQSETGNDINTFESTVAHNAPITITWDQGDNNNGVTLFEGTFGSL